MKPHSPPHSPSHPVMAVSHHENPNLSRLPIHSETLHKLQQLANIRGLEPAETLHHLIETEIRRFDLSDPSHQPLTAKQKLVIGHLRAGLSVKEVADAMRVSEQTVRTHILRARSRLGHSDLLSLRFH